MSPDTLAMSQGNDDRLQRQRSDAIPMSTFGCADALAWRESFDPKEPSVMLPNKNVATDVGDFTVREVADQLAVVMWADDLLKSEVETIASLNGLLGLNALRRLESLLTSLRPVAETRRQLAMLDGNTLLNGFELWATRQRAVVDGLASTSSGRE